jgi:LemA protein
MKSFLEVRGIEVKFSIKLLCIILAVIAAIALLCVFAFNSVPNKAYAYEEQIKTAMSDIKVQEKRRADLIPNLVDCVKQYDKHEYETLMAVVKARGTSSDNSVNEIQTMINAVAEAYPELKSNSNYKELMNELSTTENLIAKYRSSYNKEVKSYNQYIRQFPRKQILDMFGYTPIEYDYLDYNVSEDAPTNLFDDK